MHHLYWIAAFNSLAFANSFKLTAYGRMVVTRVSSRKLAFPTATLLLASNQKAPTGERENPSLSPRSKQKSVPIPVTPSPQKKRKSPSPASLDGSVLTSFDVAAVNPTQPYIDLCVSPEELRPSATLTTGQCFHWKVVKNKEDDEEHQSAWGAHNATEWVGTIRSPTSSIVVAIRETPTTTLYRPLTSCSCDLRELLCNYFQLQYPLNELYKEWSKADGRMAEIARCIPGGKFHYHV